MNCDKLTITPINKLLKEKSNIDFRELLERIYTGELNWCWDDGVYNKAKAGEYFAFMFYGKKVIIHKILAVKPPSERLPSWSQNVGQTDRNVLELSEPLKEISWNEWLENDGPLAHLGTYTTCDLSVSRPKLYACFESLQSKTVSRGKDVAKPVDYVASLENENAALKKELELLKQQLYNSSIKVKVL
jgi:hypothetical protein